MTETAFDHVRIAPAITPAMRTATTPLVRRIALSDLLGALAQGWADFLASPTQLLFLCLLFPVTGLLVAKAAAGYDIIPLLFPLVAGLSLLGPVLAVGVYELSRRRERALPVAWTDAFDVLRSPALFAIGCVGALLLAVFGVWVAVAQAIFDATIGVYQPVGLDQFADATLRTPEGWRMIVFGNLAGFVLASLVLTVSVISIPMLLDRPATSPGTAIATSIQAVRQNPGAIAAWGLIVAVVLALGCVPLFLGLAIAMPVLGHATWHLYRRVVV